MVLGLLADQTRAIAGVAGQTHESGDMLAQARAELAGRGEDDKHHFEAALAHAQRAYGHREDNVFWLDSQPCALLRYCAMEIGRFSLVARGVLVNSGGRRLPQRARTT